MKSQWHSVVIRNFSLLRKAPLVPILILLVVVIGALVPSYLAPHDPDKQVLGARLTPPFWMKDGNIAYLLGTDGMGRDILSRIIHGARVSFIVGGLALVTGGFIGTAIGLISGYFGGRFDAVVMRAADSTMAFPIILFGFLLVVTMGPSMGTVVLAVSLVLWARFARIVRGEVLSMKERDFIQLAKVGGCSSSRIILIHIFPNIVNTLVVLLTLQLGWVIIIEASLSFLGAGIPPPTATWGSMISEGRRFMAHAWWVVAMPSIALALTVLSFNLLGDWLRDRIDPTLSNL